MSDGIFIEHDGFRSWLKWHRGLKEKGDTVFTAERVLECLNLGGSVEIDLVKHKGGGFVALHDKTLERETTGTGRVADTKPAVLKSLELRDVNGEPSGHHVLLLSDIARLLADKVLPKTALLQLDFKEGRGTLTPDDVIAFQQAVAPLINHVILSGGDAEVLRYVSSGLSDIQLGFDPSDPDIMLETLHHRTFETFVENALAAMPDAVMIYLDYRFVLEVDHLGFDMIAAFHRAGKRIDAWTINQANQASLPQVMRLLDLRCDQITTDEPMALEALVYASKP